MISISLVMIVKNGERVLARCLDSFRNVVDEIVIVDTGSTDSTKAIAAGYTDRIYDFEWVDDFSAARNFAFSKATKDYIYSADADEMIDGENIEKFMALKEAMQPEIEMVQMVYVNRHEYTTTENYERDLRPKLYKRLRKFRWVEPVHEAVSMLPLVYDSDIEILHMPENAHAGRDFGIFEKTIKAQGSLSERLRHMYAQELMLAGEKKDLDAAAAYFDALAHDGESTEDIRTECYCVLARQARLSADVNGFFKWALKNVSTAPCSEICCELGQYFFDAADLEEASVWFLNAAEETEAVLVAASGGEHAYEMLAHCYEKTAGLHPEIKEECLRIAIEYKAKAKDNRKA
ncbi:MAG: glycosyltransferase family 2 protein [Lachnospiraceae bacterium]|nr:glycosyltransferase family 2 protein [Lachnospiraceae bacterium]